MRRAGPLGSPLLAAIAGVTLVLMLVGVAVVRKDPGPIVAAIGLALMLGALAAAVAAVVRPAAAWPWGEAQVARRNGLIAYLAVAFLALAAAISAHRPGSEPVGDPPPVLPLADDAVLEVQVGGGGARASIAGRSNLPNGTEFVVKVSRDGRTLEREVVVLVDGRFATGRLPRQGSLPPGTYEVKAVMTDPPRQRPLVRLGIGDRGEHLAGERVVERRGFRIVERIVPWTVAAPAATDAPAPVTP